MVHNDFKISVLFIETGSGFGGTGKYLYELLKRLDRARFEPHVIYAQDAPNIERIKALGIPLQKLALNIYPIKIPILNYLHLVFLFIFFIFPNALKITKVLKNKKISVVYLNNEIFSHFSSILAAKISGKKVICHNHGLRRLTLIEKFFIIYIDFFICVSKATFEAIKKDVGRKPIKVVYNGLDMDDYYLSEIVLDKNIEALRRTNIIIGMTGRIVPWKGHLIFAEAAKLILSGNNQNIRFVVVGDDTEPGKPYLTLLKKYIQDNGLGNNFIFTGWHQDANCFVYGFDIYVHPSVQPEPFGLAIIEAMALGRPVIASRIGAIPEIVENGVNGFLFKAGDSLELAEKIEFLLKNKEIRSKLARVARYTVAQKFNIHHNVRQIEEIIYEEVTRENS